MPVFVRPEQGQRLERTDRLNADRGLERADAGFDSLQRRRKGIEPGHDLGHVVPGRPIFLGHPKQRIGQWFDSAEVDPIGLKPPTNGLLLCDAPITLTARGRGGGSVQPAGVEPARFDIVVTGDPIEMASSKRGVSLSMAEVELEFLGEPLILSVTAIVPAEESEGQIAFDLVEVN